MKSTTNRKTPKLPLTADERSALRRHGLRIADIGSQTPPHLSSCLNISEERASELIALAEFQSIPSIGPKLASDLVLIGYLSLAQLRDKEGSTLIDELEARCGSWIDPCVEDQMRLVVHYANHPNSNKQWWDFTEERKAFRAQYGYPTTRPTKSWLK